MDTIGDMLTIIRNGYLSKKKTVVVPFSRMKKELARIFQKEGYLDQVQENEKKTRNSKVKILTLTLRYNDGSPVLSGVKRVSKPGRRVYKGNDEVLRVLGGMGLTILSTPQGLMTNKEAKKKALGGEVVCIVW
ncbi:MAG TPA: 30S ribosomal protein S8 [Patescibacteria group bacterium]|nr:30S ribosomal protein S8 [Patescibacteria group bacterium]